MKTIVIFDLEATCWDESTTYDKKESEIIEIGAIRINQDTAEIIDKFDRFVRPTDHVTLSEFCKNLTTIQQSDVNSANTINIVLNEFNSWLGNDDTYIMSWGNYDVNQIKRELYRKQIFISGLLNKLLSKHVNLKDKFANINNIKPCGVGKALTYIRVPFVGTPHRGIDDSINISILYKSIKDRFLNHVN